MDREAVADILSEIGTLLELKGENPFKCRAYFNAARALETLENDLGTLVREKRVGEIKGIGDALQQKITELVTTGKLAYYDELKASLPAGLPDLLQIPGLGPKKIKMLYEKLQVDSVEKLEAACISGKVAVLAGFGEKTSHNILDGIARRRDYASRFRFGDVIEMAEDLADTLRQHPHVTRVSLAGGLRRGKETVKDIDLVVSSPRPALVMNAFVSLPGVEKVVNHGETKSSVLLEGGVPCDLRVVPDAQFASALLHFTGSKEHNVALRQRAIARGLKLSEWGLAPESSPQPAPFYPTEESVYRALGLDFIPPELREDCGEIDAAENGKIPRLVEWTELHGCFHNHTSSSDGHNTLLEMAEAARELGMDYLGIADHSKSSFQANGLSEQALLQQVEAIRTANKKWDDFQLFAGSEVDILKDGQLDYGDDILKQLDYVVASVHAVFTLSEEAMTRRIIRAMENPYVTMLGHATGRLLLSRDPYALDVEKVIDAAAETGTWIELNANPWRLDLDWRWWHRARDKGVRCVLNPDAHRVRHLGYLKLGIHIARKGWLRKEDIMNCLPLAKIKKELTRKAQQDR
jgi:DNA polymerase (family 10)